MHAQSHVTIFSELRVVGSIFHLYRGSLFVKSPRGGRGHGSDFTHILHLHTLRLAKYKSEVLGHSWPWFGNND